MKNNLKFLIKKLNTKIFLIKCILILNMIFIYNFILLNFIIIFLKQLL